MDPFIVKPNKINHLINQTFLSYDPIIFITVMRVWWKTVIRDDQLVGL